MHPNVHNSIFCNSQDMETTYVSINRWMNKEDVVHTYTMEYSSAIKEEWNSAICTNMNGPQHARFPCPSQSSGVCSNSWPLSRWCHPTISSSVVPFSSCLQSFPASGSSPMSWLFTSGDQSIGASATASVLPMNIQDWFPLGLTGLISLLSKIFIKYM